MKGSNTKPEVLTDFFVLAGSDCMVFFSKWRRRQLTATSIGKIRINNGILGLQGLKVWSRPISEGVKIIENQFGTSDGFSNFHAFQAYCTVLGRLTHSCHSLWLYHVGRWAVRRRPGSWGSEDFPGATIEFGESQFQSCAPRTFRIYCDHVHCPNHNPSFVLLSWPPVLLWC